MASYDVTVLGARYRADVSGDRMTVRSVGPIAVFELRAGRWWKVSGQLPVDSDVWLREAGCDGGRRPRLVCECCGNRLFDQGLPSVWCGACDWRGRRPAGV